MAASSPARPLGSWASDASPGASPSCLALFKVTPAVHRRARKRPRDPVAERRELRDLLAASDFVSLHVPLTTQTQHLIDATRLAADEARGRSW